MDIGKKLGDLKRYFVEVYRESKRITWTSRKDSIKGMYTVLVIVIIAALFLAIVDIGLARFIKALFGG